MDDQLPLAANMKGITESRRDVCMVRSTNLEIDPDFNVRDKTPELEAHIEWLYQNIFIQGNGVTEPLKGYFKKETGKFCVTNGHNRYDALQLGIERGHEPILVPTLHEDRNADKATHIATMLTANSGMPLTALEKARVCQRLHHEGWSSERIAGFHNPAVTRQQVDNLLLLASATPAVKELIVAGEISPTTVINEIRAADDDPAQAERVVLETVASAKNAGIKPTGEIAKQVRDAVQKDERVQDKRAANAATQPDLFGENVPGSSASTADLNPSPAHGSEPEKEVHGHVPVQKTRRLSRAEIEAAVELRDVIQEAFPMALDAKGDGMIDVPIRRSDYRKICDLIG